MKNYTAKSLIFGGFWGLVFALLFSANNASAQQIEGAGVGISPLTFELTANPGDEINNQIKVYNPSNSTIGIRMTVEDFAVSGEAGQVKVEPAETETYSLATWITFEPNEFILAPGEFRMVDFKISVPQLAEPGGHYGAVLAGTTGVSGGEFTGAAVAGRVGSLVLLNVSGETKEALTVKEFNTSKSYFQYGPVDFDIRFENSGTVHVKPKGYITITNWLGRKIADIPLPENNVLPSSVRKMEASWNGKWLLNGKYTATLVGSYGSSNIPLTPTVITFWAFPWKEGLGVLAIMILLILIRRRWMAAIRILFLGEKK